MNIYVPAKGNPNCRIVFLGEAPSTEEEIELQPLVGPSGRFLNQLLQDVGIKREECWITNVSKYMVIPQNKYGKKIPFIERAKLAGVDIDAQLNELRTELSQLHPNIIVCLGATALWALTGKCSKAVMGNKKGDNSTLTQWRGSIQYAWGRKIIATFHPAHILHSEGESSGYWQKYVMLEDLKRVLKQSLFPEVILPYRNLNICESVHQFNDFTSRYSSSLFPSIDIEARDCIPVCIGIAFNKTEGITVPLWNHDGISSIRDNELVNLWNNLSLFLSKHGVVGQNFGYDRDKIRKLGFIINALKSDTMLKAFAINPEWPKNLAFNTSIYTEEPYYKDEGMYEGSIQDLFLGCARDACVTKEIDEAMDLDIDGLQLRQYYENFLLPLHDLYAYIESNGLRTDETIRQDLLRKYIEWDERNQYNLYQLSGHHINIGSWQQVRKLLFEQWNLPEKPTTGEEDLTKLLNSPQVKDEIHRRGIECILEGRRVKKTIDNYLYTPTDFDGRMRTSYFICLETGRSSTMQQEPPVRPYHYFKDENGKRDYRARGMAFQTITKHGDIGADVRKMFICDEGEVFLQADSSQAEARVIFLLAEDYQALKDIDKHDYHALTASWFFGGCEDDYSKKKLGYESPIRFAGKTLRHAGHLGAGKRRASIEVNTQARKFKIDLKISEASAEKALKIFHAKQPRIKEVFHNGIIKCLQKDRRLIAPVPHGIEANRGGVRTFFERWGDELFRQAFSYIPQRSVSENTKAAALRIRKRAPWIKILVESHDALLTSLAIERKEEAALILKEEFERPIDFGKCSLERPELIIPCEIEVGFNYYELSKFKFLTENVT